MKTKTVTASGHDAYDLGWLVGNKQMSIRDFEVLDWENDYKEYRRGYNAGYHIWYKQNKQIIKNKKG